MRTSRFNIFIRSTVVVFVIYMMLALIWNAATGTRFWHWSEMAISAVLTVTFFGGLAWLITNFGMTLLFGRKAEYRAYRSSGGDPFFDSLPRVFNPDSRQTGMDEPQTDFVPPASWQFLCPQCGVRVQHRVDVCWNCFYGQDSDNSAYFERYGDVQPPEISDADWAEIKRRHDV